MGFLYQKSRSESFGSYFSKPDSFEKPFNRYDVKRQKIEAAKSKNVYIKQNRGGLPLSWSDDKEYVSVDQTDSHSLIIGPTGSKKTRLIAMPAVRILGAAGESIIISDPKAEIYLRAAEHLNQMGYEVNVINLRNPDFSKRWNPLYIPYRFFCSGDIDKACEFANDIAQNMVPSNLEKDVFWSNSAASLLFGLILLLFMLCRENNLPETEVNLKNIFELRNTLFAGTGPEIKNSFLWKYAQKDTFIKNSLIGTVETANDTRGGILSTFDQAMRNLSIQPDLLNMLSGNEIDLDLFLEKKQALFMIIPDEKTSYHQLVSLFIKQSYEYFIYLAQRNVYDEGVNTGILPIRINYVLDEFSSLPTVADFPAMITAARSRNIRFTLFVQSKHQLTQRYDKEVETILANCTNWIFLTTRELSLLEDISKLCGAKGGKPILPVAQLQRLSKEEGEVLILSGRNKPYITMLPDIDVYDGGAYQPLRLKQTDLPVLDSAVSELLEKMKAEAMAKDRGMMNPFENPAVRRYAGDSVQSKTGEKAFQSISSKEIDRMIADIDRKLKELDEEEKEIRTQEERKNED